MPFGIRDRISSITKKYREKQATKHKEKEELDAIYEKAKVKHLKTEVDKRAKEAAKEASKRKYPSSSPSLMKRMTGGLRGIGKVAKSVDPNINPFADSKTFADSKKMRTKSKISEDPFATEGKMWMGDMDYGDRDRPRDNSHNRHQRKGNRTTINEDPFEAEGKKWMGDMGW